MSDLSVFDFQNKKVRVVEYQGQPWFVLRDLLNAMGSSTPTTVALESIKQGLGEGFNEVIPLLTAGGEQQVIVIAEAAATYLVARSNTELGRQLNRFIHIEVLPQLRQKGFYQLTPQNNNQSIVHIENQLLTIAKQQQAMFAVMQAQHQEMVQEIEKIKQQQQEIQWSCEWTANDCHQLTVYFWDLHKLHPKLQLASDKINILYDVIRQWRNTALQEKTVEKAKVARKPAPRKAMYTAASKAALKETLKNLPEIEAKDYKKLAQFLNEKQMPTLSGQGEWTAAKIKRLLHSS